MMDLNKILLGVLINIIVLSFLTKNVYAFNIFDWLKSIFHLEATTYNCYSDLDCCSGNTGQYVDCRGTQQSGGSIIYSCYSRSTYADGYTYCSGSITTTRTPTTTTTSSGGGGGTKLCVKDGVEYPYNYMYCDGANRVICIKDSSCPSGTTCSGGWSYYPCPSGQVCYPVSNGVSCKPATQTTNPPATTTIGRKCIKDGIDYSHGFMTCDGENGLVCYKNYPCPSDKECIDGWIVYRCSEGTRCVKNTITGGIGCEPKPGSKKCSFEGMTFEAGGTWTVCKSNGAYFYKCNGNIGEMELKDIDPNNPYCRVGCAEDGELAPNGKPENCCSKKAITITYKEKFSFNTIKEVYCGDENTLSDEVKQKIENIEITGKINGGDCGSDLINEINKELGLGCTISKIILIMGIFIAFIFLISLLR